MLNICRFSRGIKISASVSNVDSDFELSTSVNPGVQLMPTTKVSMYCQVTIVYIKLGIMDKGEICIVLHEIFKLRPDLSIKSEEMEAFL